MADFDPTNYGEVGSPVTPPPKWKRKLLKEKKNKAAEERDREVMETIRMMKCDADTLLKWQLDMIEKRKAEREKELEDMIE